MKLSLESRHPATDCRLIIDDDGRVAYAYLLDPEGVIVGDVWLYNRADPGAEIDFEGPAPFLNPLTTPPDQPPPSSATDLRVVWTMDEQTLTVDVRLRGALLARLSPGSQPGWNSWALAGPLASPLEKEPE